MRLPLGSASQRERFANGWPMGSKPDLGADALVLLRGMPASLRRRWEEGCQNGERLYEELQARGYTGSIRALYRYLNRWQSPRKLQENPSPSKRRTPRRKKTIPPPGPFDDCNAKQAVWLYFRSHDDL